MPDLDNDVGDIVTDIVICCCDTDLCNYDSNGAEGTYFSVFAISITLLMAMAI